MNTERITIGLIFAAVFLLVYLFVTFSACGGLDWLENFFRRLLKKLKVKREKDS